MKQIIYEWVRNIVSYQLIVSIVINMIPQNEYIKYVRFFLGMLFLLITIQPVIRIFSLTETIDTRYAKQIWEREVKENTLEWNLEEWSEPGGKNEISKNGDKER